MTKSLNLQTLNGENCRKLQNFSKNWGIETNFGQNGYPIMWKSTLSERHFNKFSYFFISWKNLVWFLSYVNLKLTISGVPLKIVNLPFWKFICACNIGQKGHTLFWKNGNQKYHHLLVQCQSIFYVFCLKIKLYIVFPKGLVSDCWTHKMSRFGPGDKMFFLMLSKS